MEAGSTGPRQRWQGTAVLARLGITPTNRQQISDEIVQRKSLVECSFFRRALSAQMDLSFR